MCIRDSSTPPTNRTGRHKVGLHRSESDGYFPAIKVAADLRAAPARPKRVLASSPLDRSVSRTIGRPTVQPHSTPQANRTGRHKVGLHRSESDGYFPAIKVAADLRAAPARPKRVLANNALDRSAGRTIVRPTVQPHSTPPTNRTGRHRVGLHRSEIDGYFSLSCSVRMMLLNSANARIHSIRDASGVRSSSLAIEACDICCKCRSSITRR